MRVTYLSGEGPASFNLGPIVAPMIVSGADGDSAYEVAVANGFDGTPAEWLESLRGVAGQSLAYIGNSYQIAEGRPLTTFDTFTHTFTIGTTVLVTLLKPKQDRLYSAAELADTALAVSLYDIVISAQNGPPGGAGDDGASAYELAVAAGFSGDLAAWLASLAGGRGDDGDDGASAYELAVAAGFSGDVAAWLASLKGEAGASMTLTVVTTQAAFDSAVATPTNWVVRYA